MRGFLLRIDENKNLREEMFFEKLQGFNRTVGDLFDEDHYSPVL